MEVIAGELTYQQRLDMLHATKLQQTREKREARGPRDADEQGLILLPLDAAEIVEAVSGSGEVVRDLILKGFEPKSNHPSGGFFGPKATGENFRLGMLNPPPPNTRPPAK